MDNGKFQYSLKLLIAYIFFAGMALVNLHCAGKSDEIQVKETAGRHADGILSWAISDILHNPEKVEWDALGRYLQAMAYRLELLTLLFPLACLVFYLRYPPMLLH